MGKVLEIRVRPKGVALEYKEVLFDTLPHADVHFNLKGIILQPPEVVVALVVVAGVVDVNPNKNTQKCL